MGNIYSKLQKCRVEVGEQCTKKTGKNTYAGFDYFTLEDFLPIANKVFEKNGLCPVFSIVPATMETAEMAVLKVFDDEGKYIEFTSTTANAEVGKNPNPIQNLGAQHTYLKRYLYMNVLELSESDVVDAIAEKEDVKQTRATLEQVDKIMELYDNENIQKIKDYYHVDNIEKLSVQQASQVIAQKKKEK